MEYFHVLLTIRSERDMPEVELDLGFAELESRFLQPYRSGTPIVISGRLINLSDLERIQIFITPYDSSNINSEILAISRAKGINRAVDTQGRLRPELLCRHGEEVTRTYIQGPPGQTLAEKVNLPRNIDPL